MAELLTRFSEPIRTTDGLSYIAQACATPNADGLWDGWIEFLSTDGGPALRSPRETTQPNRTDVEYWASGLTTVYLEGALTRALSPPPRQAASLPNRSVFDEPASPAMRRAGGRDAVLDPFSLYKKASSFCVRNSARFRRGTS